MARRSRRGDASEDGPSDAWRSYLRSIRNYQLLTESGERRLGLEIERGAGTAARQKLVEANLRLVIRIAGEYRDHALPRDELVAEGNLGLIEAARRYDPGRRVRFASYAGWWIRKYILSALRRQSLQTSVGAGGGTASRAGRQRVLSFEEFMESSSERHALERFAPAAAAEPETVVLEHQLAEALRSVLHRLPDHERTVLEAHYGLSGRPPITLQEIGRLLGCTRERVRQIELRALTRVRQLLGGGRASSR